MATEYTRLQKRDIAGNLKVELDPVRAKTSYCVGATNFSGVAGVQVFANAGGNPIYIDRLYLKDNTGGGAGTISIYDGTVAGGTLIARFTFASAGTLDLSGLGLLAATSTNGIYVKTTVSTSTDLLLSVYSDQAVQE
jgi:hypothetical protein